MSDEIKTPEPPKEDVSKLLSEAKAELAQVKEELSKALKSKEIKVDPKSGEIKAASEDSVHALLKKVDDLTSIVTTLQKKERRGWRLFG